MEQTVYERVYQLLSTEQLKWEFRTLHESLYGEDGRGIKPPESYWLMLRELEARGILIGEIRSVIFR